MKGIKEIWKLVFDWLGNGKKVIMGLAFLAAGAVLNLCLESASKLSQSAFILFLTGALFLVNALFSKVIKCNINVLLYTLVFVVIMELGIYLMMDLDRTFTSLVSVWGPCFLFVWALQYVVLQLADVDGVAKRLVIAFFDSLVGAAAVVAAFMVPIWLAL